MAFWDSAFTACNRLEGSRKVGVREMDYCYRVRCRIENRFMPFHLTAQDLKPLVKCGPRTRANRLRIDSGFSLHDVSINLRMALRRLTSSTMFRSLKPMTASLIDLRYLKRRFCWDPERWDEISGETSKQNPGPNEDLSHWQTIQGQGALADAPQHSNFDRRSFSLALPTTSLPRHNYFLQSPLDLRLRWHCSQP